MFTVYSQHVLTETIDVIWLGYTSQKNNTLLSNNIKKNIFQHAKEISKVIRIDIKKDSILGTFLLLLYTL
jgi:hypothetical protein